MRINNNSVPNNLYQRSHTQDLLHTMIHQQITSVLVCDGTGHPIVLVISANSANGKIMDMRYFHMDGTPYTGVISAIVHC